MLYFEGAGGDFVADQHSDVGNYRIRTSFKNNEGIPYYLEISGMTVQESNGIVHSFDTIHVDYCFKIGNKENKERETINKVRKHGTDYRYTRSSITKWINSELNCSFDTIDILDQYYGYYAHGPRSTYHLIENHIINHEQAARRKIAYEEVCSQYRKMLGKKYSVISIIEMDDSSITIRCHVNEKELKLSGLPRIKKIAIHHI